MRPSGTFRALSAAVLAGTALLALSAAVFAEEGPPAAENQAAATEDRIVATVNGRELTEGDMRLADAEIGRHLGDLSPPKRRRALAEFLLEDQLLADAAEEAKLVSSPEFARRMRYWRRRVLRELYFNEAIRPTISEAEARAVYEEEIKSFVPEEEIEARHILTATEEEARNAADRLAAGADFVKLAREVSQDLGTKEEGGILGFFVRGQMVPEFEDAAFKLKKGQVSPPVHSQFGWHVIRVEERRLRQPPAFEQVKDRIMNTLIYRHARSIAKDLRAKAQIRYLDPVVKREVEEQRQEESGGESGERRADAGGKAPLPGAGPHVQAPALPPRP